jgi:hypothetical protein
MRLITKKHISRRTLLRGIGTAVSLPLLDAMVPRTPRSLRPLPRHRSASASVSCRTAL